MMSKNIQKISAGGTQAGPGNPPEQSSSDGSSAGAQYLQAPNSSPPHPTNGTKNEHDTNTHTITKQDNFDLSLSDDTSDGLSGVGNLQIYETDEEDIKLISSDPTVSATTASEKVVKGASQGDKKKGRKTDEQKREDGYKRSLRFIRQMESKDSSSLTTRDKRLIRKHNFHVRKYESKTNTTVVEVKPPTAKKDPTTTDANDTKTNINNTDDRPTTSNKAKAPAPSSSKSTNAAPKPRSDPVSKAGQGNQGRINPVPKGKERRPLAKTEAGGKRQRSGDTQVPDGKRVKKSTSLSSAPELQVAILDRSNPEGKISTARWLLIEECILRSLSEAVIQCEDDSFTEFDGAKWQKGVKIIGCGNKKALDFLSACINGLDTLWPGMKVEIVPIDQIPSWTTVRVWFPPPILEDEAILRLVKVQNKYLQSQDWSIVRGRARDKGDGKDLWIRVGSESLRLLKLSHGIVKFGLNHLTASIPSDTTPDAQIPTRHATGAD